MKKNFILLALIGVFFSVAAQQVESTKVNTRDNNPARKYMRPSLTIIYVNRGDARSQRMQTVVEKFPVPGKYNDHNVATRAIQVNSQNGLSVHQLQKFLTENVSREIVAKWFNRNEKGEFSMDLIAERGLYNASDAEVIKAKASQRKMALLEDAGENLLDRSYILVFDVKKILTADEYARLKNKPTNDEEGYYAFYDCYLFRLDWNDSIAAIFYNNLWTDASSFDPNKVAAFNQTTFPIKFVDKVSNAFGYVSVTQNKDHSRNIFGSLTDDQMFAKVFDKIMDEAETQLAQRNEDFKVKIPIFSTDPLSAKAGLKEGLSVDKRFFVYEFELDSKGNKKAVRKGVVRASNKITDNRQIATGQTEPSRFYQVAGRRLYEGMMLQENPDWGFGLTVGYGSTSGVVGEGLSLLLEFNTSLYLGKIRHTYPTGVKIYGMGNLALQNFKLDINNNIDDPTNPEFSVVSYSFGISKDLNFFRNFVLVPFVGYGIEEYTNTATGMSKDKYDATFFEVGGRLGMNLSYNIQLLATYSFNPISSVDYEKNNDIQSLTQDQMDLFKEQRKAGQLTIGLRFQF